jgi:hypothetical protein
MRLCARSVSRTPCHYGSEIWSAGVPDAAILSAVFHLVFWWEIYRLWQLISDELERIGKDVANWGTVLEVAWRSWEERCAGMVSNRTPRLYKSIQLALYLPVVFLFHVMVMFFWLEVWYVSHQFLILLMLSNVLLWRYCSCVWWSLLSVWNSTSTLYHLVSNVFTHSPCTYFGHTFLSEFAELTSCPYNFIRHLNKYFHIFFTILCSYFFQSSS